MSRDDEVHSLDKKCATTATCECAVITGLGFQKEMTHPSDGVEKTMNTHIIYIILYIYILCVYKHLPRGPVCDVGDVPVYKMPFIILRMCVCVCVMLYSRSVFVINRSSEAHATPFTQWTTSPAQPYECNVSKTKIKPIIGIFFYGRIKCNLLFTRNSQ